MKKKKYVKPGFELVSIELNDLCAASVCTTIDMSSVKLRKMDERRKTYTLSSGDSKNMWDTKF